MAFDSGNVIAGSGALYLAAVGATFPSLSGPGAPLPAAWATALFSGAGYTDDGVDFSYAPTFKDITVDEEMSPVNQLLTAEKMSVKVRLAEATLENLAMAIAGGSLTTVGGVKILKVGSAVASGISEICIGFQGPSPDGPDTRVITVFRAKNVATVSLKYQRADKVVYEVEWTALADGTRSAGDRLYRVYDFPESGS